MPETFNFPRKLYAFEGLVFERDARISDEILKQTSDVYRKIRNTLRFMLGNINDFNPDTDSIPESELLEVDRYLLTPMR